MIGHLVARVRAEKYEALLRIEDFCEEQEGRVKAKLAEMETRRREQRVNPFVAEWEPLEMEVRR